MRWRLRPAAHRRRGDPAGIVCNLAGADKGQVWIAAKRQPFDPVCGFVAKGKGERLDAFRGDLTHKPGQEASPMAYCARRGW